MTVEKRYLEILSRVTPNAPLDLDPLLFDMPKPTLDDAFATAGAFVPSAALWLRDEFGPSYIGIRVKTTIEAPQTLAASVAAAAVERQIVPVFLSWNGACDMQRFGFRVEYVSGPDDAACLMQEQQLARLWNMAIIVDAQHVIHMG